MASICRSKPNTLAQQTIYRIHPAIGVARVGNSPSEFFIGPEKPGRPATGQDGGAGSPVPPAPGATFKDSTGRIKRQAARFRIWKYVWNAAKKQYLPREEIHIHSPHVKRITWKVELANRKASFFEFQGTNGETSPYGAGHPYVDALRNAGVVGAAARAATLEIVPGEKTISGAGAGPVEFRRSVPGIPIDYLGELRTDSDGRLLVLGGHGTTLSSVAPAAPLPTYANNDNWFDDISDGPVRVEIEFDTGVTVPSDQIEDAWVLVGPPDFAPEISNLVSLWDTLSDVAVQHLTFTTEDGLFHEYAPGKGLDRLRRMKADFAGGTGFTGYRVSFRQEIYPIVQRVLNYSFVHHGAYGHHAGFPWAQMAAPLAAANKPTKDMFFGWIRPAPGITRPADPALMSNPYMPKLLGDEAEEDLARGVPEPNPRQFLTLTAVQYAHLLQWWKGVFDPDGWPASNSPADLPPPPNDIRPEGLDRAAAENCVGGAFYPGIEVSWLIRNPNVYGDFWGPMRIDPWQRNATNGRILLDGGGQPLPKEITYGSHTIKMRAGFFSQQMALPWQADFMDCNIEKHGGMEWGWWPAQRPDWVLEAAAGPQIEWSRTFGSHEDMVRDWGTRGFVEADGAGYIEKEGPPPPPPPPPAPVVPPAPSGGGGICFIATAAYGSPLAPEVRMLQDIRDNVLRGMDWGRAFFETYWKYYYRISPAVAEEMRKDPELRKTMRWSIVEPWTNYMKLLLARPDWDRLDMQSLDPALRDFLSGLRADMEAWVGAIPLPESFEHPDPLDSVRELNVILDFVLRTGGGEYLARLRASGALPLRHTPEQEAALLESLRKAGRTEEEIALILRRAPPE